MNPFLNPPDPSTRQPIDTVPNEAEVSDPPTSRSLVAATPWPPPPPDASGSPTLSGVSSWSGPGSDLLRRWPRSPLQRFTAALLALLGLGGLAVLVGLPSADGGDVLDGLGSYLTVVGLGVAGAGLSVVTSSRRSSMPRSTDDTDALVFRIVFGALAALILVVVLQSDTQNVVNADGQTAHLWAIIGGFAERLARPFAANPPGSAADR